MNKKEFPKLMIGLGGVIILATGYNRHRDCLKGSILKASDNKTDTGVFSEHFLADCFVDYEGELTIWNE
jgi:hypothetical protein